jgi:cobalamin biosynthesis protein CbiG
MPDRDPIDVANWLVSLRTEAALDRIARALHELVQAVDAAATAAEYRGGVEVATWCAISSVVREDDAVVVRIERGDDSELVVTIRGAAAASGAVAA